jgi:hypothetical protein
MSKPKTTGATVRHMSAPPGIANEKASTTIATITITRSPGKPFRLRP